MFHGKITIHGHVQKLCLTIRGYVEPVWWYFAGQKVPAISRGDGRSFMDLLWSAGGSMFDFLEWRSWSWQRPFPKRCLPLTTGPASKQSVGGENEISSLYSITRYLAQIWSFEMLNCILATCSYILSQKASFLRQSLSRSEGPYPRSPHSASCLLSCKLPAQSIW